MDQKTVSLEGKFLGYEKKTLAVVGVVIIAALVAFYAGAKYEKHKLSALGLLSGSKNSSKKAAAANPSLKGTVTAKDDKSVTIKMADGTTKTISYSPSMTFGKSGTGSASEVFVGELVVIAGENDANGNFVPTNIRASKKSPKAPAPGAPTNGTPAQNAPMTTAPTSTSTSAVTTAPTATATTPVK